MAKNDLLSAIDQAIAALQQARKALRTKSSAPTQATAKSAAPARRGMSEEGRQRIAEAQRQRWAKQKRTAKKATRLAK